MPFEEADAQNVLVVRRDTHFRTLINKVKDILRNESDNIEMQAVDDASYETVSSVAECLLNYKYVTLRQLNTQTHHTPMKKHARAANAPEMEDG